MKTSRWLLMGTMLILPGPLFAAEPPSPEEIKAEQAALFAQADDGDGKLSLDEFRKFESLVRDKMTEHHFQRMDTNGDGVVSLEELQAEGPGRGPGHPGGPPPWRR
jgi:hypothetical protein